MKIEEIKNPKFLKDLNINELNVLSNDIRKFLIESISKTGGHLSSNLGIVELTIAIHKVFDIEKDKLIFDVGHQCYVHKILTGRANEFNKLRQFNGLSGFQCIKESKYDYYESGHSSTSISAALGFAISRDMNKEKYNVISVIGDGSICNGLCYEAINNISNNKSKVIIILNDNEMSISKNIGAVRNQLDKIRSASGYENAKSNTKRFLNKIPLGKYINSGIKNVKKSFKKLYLKNGFIFEEMGLTYYGPINGHDFNELITYLNIAKKENNSVILHVITEKGKGYKYASEDVIGKWHGVGSFDIESGKFLNNNSNKSWSEIISNKIFEEAKKDKDIVAITPAMSVGSKLENFRKELPKQFIDVGIAEEHALILASSMAINGKKPFVSIYSSFLQRGYDQIVHDIARMHANVLVGIDRCGIIGEDGVSHQGIYDISFLISIPDIVICSPRNNVEAINMIDTLLKYNGPKFIRYSKEKVCEKEYIKEDINIGSWETLSDGKDLVIISYGDFVNNSLVIKDMLKKDNINATVVNARFIKPVDKLLLNKIIKLNKPIFVYEESTSIGSLGSYIVNYVNNYKFNNKIYTIGIPDNFIYHGNKNVILEDIKLDVKSVYKFIKKNYIKSVDKINKNH